MSGNSQALPALQQAAALRRHGIAILTIVVIDIGVELRCRRQQQSTINQVAIPFLRRRIFQAGIAVQEPCVPGLCICTGQANRSASIGFGDIVPSIDNLHTNYLCLRDRQGGTSAKVEV